jgi:hypothetical protein
MVESLHTNLEVLSPNLSTAKKYKTVFKRGKSPNSQIARNKMKNSYSKFYTFFPRKYKRSKCLPIDFGRSKTFENYE